MNLGYGLMLIALNGSSAGSCHVCDCVIGSIRDLCGHRYDLVLIYSSNITPVIKLIFFFVIRWFFHVSKDSPSFTCTSRMIILKFVVFFMIVQKYSLNSKEPISFFFIDFIIKLSSSFKVPQSSYLDKI